MLFIHHRKPLAFKHVAITDDPVASPVLKVPHPVRRSVGKIEIHWPSEALFNKPTDHASFHVLSHRVRCVGRPSNKTNK
jgi:hypothetical protein